MRKLFAVVLLVAAGAMVAPAIAEIDVETSGEIRTRWEYFDNMSDFQDSFDPGLGTVADDSYDIWGHLVRLGIEANFDENVRAVIQIQNMSNFGRDDPRKVIPNPITQFEATGDSSDDIDLYQGFIEIMNINDSAWSLSIGRMEYTIGNELLMGDWDFYAGQVFDGVSSHAEFESWNLDLFLFNTMEANQGCSYWTGQQNPPFSGNCGADDQFLWGGAADFMIGEDQEIQPYVIGLKDGNEFGFIPSYLLGITLGKMDLYTVGGRWTRPVQVEEEKLMDWNLEAAMQTGDVGVDDTGFTGTEMDAGGYLAEGWLGFNFFGDSMTNRIHAGFLMASGDDDLTDTDWDAFISLYGDTRDHQRLGNMDMEAVLGLTFVNSFNVGWTGTIRDYTHKFYAGVHFLELAEDSIDFGGGPVDVQDGIGTSIDLGYWYAFSEQLSFGLDVTLFQGDDVVDNLTQGLFGEDSDDAMRVGGYAQLQW